jgi:hypothetical protein
MAWVASFTAAVPAVLCCAAAPAAADDAFMCERGHGGAISACSRVIERTPADAVVAHARCGRHDYCKGEWRRN